MEGEEFYTYLADLSTEEDSTPSKNVQTIRLETTDNKENLQYQIKFAAKIY